MAYRCGMKPSEFWDCTYREIRLYVQSFLLQKKEEMLWQAELMEGLSDKLLFSNPNIVKHPKKIRILDTFKEMFKDMLKKDDQQDYEAMIRNMRSRM